MSLFNRKETLIFKTAQQRDAYIERLDAARVEYEVVENKENIYSRDVGRSEKSQLIPFSAKSKQMTNECLLFRFIPEREALIMRGIRRGPFFFPPGIPG